MKSQAEETKQDQIAKARIVFAQAFLEGNMLLALSAAKAWNELVDYEPDH